MLLQFIIMKMVTFKLQAYIVMTVSIKKIKLSSPASVYSCNTSKKIPLRFERLGCSGCQEDRSA